MDAQLKQKWLEALRGETYAQGRNLLRQRGDKQDSFCCLGVLCDLVAPDEWLLEENGRRYDHSGNVGHLPGPIASTADLSSDQCFTLMGMNDNGQTFAQIADWIEANIPAEGQQS